MFGSFFRFVAAVILVGILGAIGVNLYQAGFVAGAAADGATVVAPWAGYGWGFGPGLGFFGSLLVLFLIIGLLRAAFGRPHRWGPGTGHGWGHGRAGRDGDAERFWGSPWETQAREAHDAWHRRSTDEPTAGGTDPNTGSATSQARPA